MLNLDTLIVVRALLDQLTPRERRLLAHKQWSISAIVLWEISKLALLGRIEEDLDDPSLIRSLNAIHIWPNTLDICRRISELDFRSDPADEIIAATSIFHRVPLLTRDEKILASRTLTLPF